MTLNDTIIVSKGRDSWLATFSGQHALQIKQLFGTDTLPLPFTPNAHPQLVRQTVQELNPEVLVILASEVQQ